MEVAKDNIMRNTYSKNLKNISNMSVRPESAKKWSTSEKIPQFKVQKKNLKGKVKAAFQAGDQLKQTLSKKNEEIAELKRSMESLNHVLHDVPSEEALLNPAGLKLKDVLRKNRSLQAQLEQARVLSNKKDVFIGSLHKELKNLRKKVTPGLEEKELENEGILEETRRELQVLQERHQTLKFKNNELQAHLNLAQKLLQQEIGEDFDLTKPSLRIGQSNWLGRAQQITQLQQREKYLTEQLEKYKTSGPETNSKKGAKYHENFSLHHNPFQNGNIYVDDVDNDLMDGSSSNNFSQNIPVTKHDLILQLDHANSKLVSAKLENKSVKKYAKDMEKKCTDMEKLLQDRSEEIKSLKTNFEEEKSVFDEKLKDAGEETIKIKQDYFEVMIKLDEASDKILKLQASLAKQDEKVHDLELKLIKSQEQISNDFRRDEVLNIIDNLEAEKTSLMEENALLQSQLTKYGAKLDKQSMQIEAFEEHTAFLEFELKKVQKSFGMEKQEKVTTTVVGGGMKGVVKYDEKKRLFDRKTKPKSLPRNSLPYM